jgi:hypothetical protein
MIVPGGPMDGRHVAQSWTAMWQRSNTQLGPENQNLNLKMGWPKLAVVPPNLVANPTIYGLSLSTKSGRHPPYPTTN